LDPDSAYWARWKFARLAIPLQDRARELGYNLIVHGSLRRDIDMVAVPWVQEAVSGDELIRELEATIRTVDTKPPEEFDAHPTTGPTEKPHGRRAWSIFVTGTYFDISVMPRMAPCERCGAVVIHVCQ
jgi:hypothetical protein